jgi:agmatinase
MPMGELELWPAACPFAGLSRTTLDGLRPGMVVVAGAAEASPYVAGQASHSAEAPWALRQAAFGFSKQVGQYDFDLGAPLFTDRQVFADLGDIATDAGDAEGNRARIKALTQAVGRAGARLLLLGGDDSVPIPWLWGFEGQGPFTVLQVDAHTDWGDVIQNNPFGYGSPMRRASEMAWVNAMVQVGARGLGSGEAWQIEDARRWGSHIVTMEQVRREGIAAAIALVEPGAKVLLSIDCDGIDPAVLPAVNMPTPGGLTYGDMVELMRGVCSKADLCGTAILEYVPRHDDSRRLSGLVAARLGAVALGLMAK